MRYYSILFLSILLFACSSVDKEKTVGAIDQVTNEMKEENFPSSENMVKIIGLYDQYIQAFPEDAKTYSYMELKAKYQAANTQYEDAISTYDAIIAKYPEDDKTADAIFMQAFIYENNIEDKDAAKGKYEQFLYTYPNHALAKDAQFSIENLYLTDEQIFQKIMDMQADTLVEVL